jgi:hypothetical protein
MKKVIIKHQEKLIHSMVNKIKEQRIFIVGSLIFFNQTKFN